MAETMLAWGRLDCDDDQAVKDGLDLLTSLLDACAVHLDKEGRYVHPAREAACPGTSGRIEGEHLHHLASIAQRRAQGDAIGDHVMAVRGPLCHQLYRAIAVFVAENLAHMEFEESQHNAVLWTGYNDAELIEIHAAIVAGTTPADMAVPTRWVAPNLRPTELLALLQSVRRDVPEEVFTGIVDMVRAHLSDPPWRQLARSMNPTAAHGLPVDLAQRFVQTLFGAAAGMPVHEGFVARAWRRVGIPPGPAGVHVMAQALSDAFGRASLRIDACLVVGEQVVLRYTFAGRHVGELFGIAATGQDFSIEGIAWLRIVDGKVAELWREEDMLGFQRQLGLTSLLAELPAQ